MAKYLDPAGVSRLVTKLKTDVIPTVKVNAAKAADTVPASGITGVIDISHIPQGALERVVTVADDTARYKLTTSQVQLGDTVKVTSTGRMYIVVDESKLTSAAGYMEYAAGTAASVPWSGVFLLVHKPRRLRHGQTEVSEILPYLLSTLYLSRHGRIQNRPRIALAAHHGQHRALLGYTLPDGVETA